MNAQIESSVDVDVDKLDTAKPLSVIFAPFQTTLEKWESKVASLTVTDISQETVQSRFARLAKEAAKARAELVAKAAREAAEAPDKAKLAAFVAMVRALPIPALKTVNIDLPSLVEDFALRIERQACIAPVKPATQQSELKV